ncbi:MAG: DNA internalization-related competence protein ComEC/Rec2 [Thiopseudomonas sp.]
MGMYALMFALGVLALRFLPVVPALWVSGILVTAALLLSLTRRRPALLLAVAMLGLCWSAWQAQSMLDQRLEPALDGRIIWLQGRVAGLPQWQTDGTGQTLVRFELAEAVSRRGSVPPHIRVSWRNPPDVRAGEHWRLAVFLRQPDGLLNPHGFDYVQWLSARRLGATGSVKAGEKLQEGSGFAAWREQVRSRLLQAMDGHPAAGGVLALAVGDGSAISRPQWQTLQDSGTVHLFVISGQHVSLVAGLAYGLVVLLVRLGGWPRWIPWLPAACGLALGSAYAYGVVSGLGVPVQRALIMVTVVLVWRLRYRSLASWTPWLLALALVVLLDPLVMLQPGFWLSFAAVAVLALVFAGRLGRWRWWQILIRAQWAAGIGLVPLLLATGLPVSWVGPLANAVAVPFVSFWMLPLVLSGLLLLPWPALSSPLLQLAADSLQGLWQLLDAMVLGWPAWQAALPAPWILVLAAVAVWLLLLPAVLRPLWLPLLLLTPLLWPPPRVHVPVGQARIWMLDVGQGQAIIVQTAGHVLAYDAGPAMGGMDAGESQVVPFLRGEGIRHLDRLILSHADADHAGGAGAVMKAVSVGRLVSGEPHRHRHWQAQPCIEHSWQWDGVHFWQWQWPDAKSGNAASCVLLVEASGERFLVTGDLDIAGERALLQAWPGLGVDWLVAGHHGSRTSTAQFWLQQLQPHSVLVSRGRYNSYGHPHPLVLARLAHNGIRLYDTARDKAMHIELGARQPLWTMGQESAFWR